MDRLEEFAAGSDVTPYTLEEARLLRKPELPVAVLGRGEINVALKVRAHRVSENAKAKIEAAGGSVEILPLE